MGQQGQTTGLWSIERIVVLLTPLFGAAAAWITAWVTTNVPGAPHLDAGSVRDMMISAFLGATAMAYKWLHGRQLPEVTTPKLMLVPSPRGDTGPPGVTEVDVLKAVHAEVPKVLSALIAAAPAAEASAAPAA